MGWQQMPQDAGKTVDVKYDCDWETRTLYRRTEDLSYGSVVLAMGRISDGEDRYEPWNGVIPKVDRWITEGGN